jgi:hypothetical protein
MYISLLIPGQSQFNPTGKLSSHLAQHNLGEKLTKQESTTLITALHRSGKEL